MTNIIEHRRHAIQKKTKNWYTNLSFPQNLIYYFIQLQ